MIYMIYQFWVRATLPCTNSDRIVLQSVGLMLTETLPDLLDQMVSIHLSREPRAYLIKLLVSYGNHHFHTFQTCQTFQVEVVISG